MKRIYIVLPANFKSGGPELGHQLAALYNGIVGIETIIAYYNVKVGVNPINKEFEHYVKHWEKYENIIDDEESVIIYPETYVNLVSDYQKAKKVIWWMSVDFYLGLADWRHYFKSFVKGKNNPFTIIHALLSTLKRQLLRKFKSFRRNIYKAQLHLYQSEYARLFLCKKGITNCMPLSDYINDMYFFNDNNHINRENRVLYNPKKGWNYTKKLIKAKPDFIWVPIQNLSTSEVVNLLRTSKVYIDFGNHPGKDRFPREAAISGCCIITGKCGAANNNIDIDIPSKFKFENTNKNICDIIELIDYCLVNYYDIVHEFDLYRNKIKHEKEQFIEEAKNLLVALKDL